jgi:hypothetical protein
MTIWFQGYLLLEGYSELFHLSPEGITGDAKLCGGALAASLVCGRGQH